MNTYLVNELKRLDLWDAEMIEDDSNTSMVRCRKSGACPGN